MPIEPYYDRDGITIYHADCLDVLPQIDAGIVITDPPYNAGKNYGKTTNDRMPWDEWCHWWDRRLEAMAYVVPDIFAFLSVTAFIEYTARGKHTPRWSMCWSKPLSLAATSTPFLPHWEPIVYWGISNKKTGLFMGLDVFTHNVTKGEWGHPTEKPIRLMRDIVSRVPEDRVILDPFMGSGTTLRAAKDLGRRAIGIDISEQFCEIAIRRLAQEVLPL